MQEKAENNASYRGDAGLIPVFASRYCVARCVVNCHGRKRFRKMQQQQLSRSPGSPQTKHLLTKSKINCFSFEVEPISAECAGQSRLFLCCEGKGGVLLFFEEFCSRSSRDKSRSRWLFEPALQDGTDSQNRHRANVDAA